MKRIVLAIGLCTMMGCSAAMTKIMEQHQDWTFVQTVGGLKVELQTGNKLKVECNVSGLKTITLKPTTMNSAMVIKKIGKKIAGDKIQIYIVTSVSDKKLSAEAGKVDLNELKPGSYQVQYLNPDGSTVDLTPIQIKAVMGDGV